MHSTRTRRILTSIALGVLFVGVSMVGVSRVYAAELSLADIVNLFIALDIIAPDKVDAARALAASYETTGNGGSTIDTAPCIAAQGPRLTLGSRGSEVIALQRQLAQDASLYPEGDVSGYYGAATVRAVQRFQTRYGIVTWGTPATTGYGAVGTQTRAKLATLCSSTMGSPVIYSASPTTVPLDGKTYVTLTGKHFAPDAYVAIEGALIDRVVPTHVTSTELRFLLPKDAGYKDIIRVHVVNPGMPLDTSVHNSVRLIVVGPDADDPISVTPSETKINSGDGVTYTIRMKDSRVRYLSLTTTCPSAQSDVGAKGSRGCDETTIVSVDGDSYVWREWYTDAKGGTFSFIVTPLDEDRGKIGAAVTTEVVVLPPDTTTDDGLEVTADSVSFDRIVDENRVGDDEQFYFEVKNPTNKRLSYQIAFDGEQPAWINAGYSKEVLHVDPSGVMGMGVSVDHTGLPVGIYRAAMLLTGDFAESPVRIPIKLNVREDTSATMRSVPDHFTFSSTPTGYYPSQTQGLKLINKTGHTVAYQVRVESGTGLFAIGFSRSSLSALTIVTPTLRAGEEVVIPVTAHATGLAYGKYTGSVVVTGEFVNTPIRVPIVLWVSDGMKG